MSLLPVRFLVLPGFLLATAWAQGPSAVLVGRVEDASGAGVPEASVRVRSVDTNEERIVHSQADGDFLIPGLAPGAYELIVEMPGFRKHVESGIQLQVDQSLRRQIRLQLGSVAESVEVTAEAPLVTTETSSKGEVISGKEISEMPLDGRDFADLAFLVPGVQRRAQGGQGSAFAVNGARGDNTNFVIDGFNDQNPRNGGVQARPNIDAMQEFKMQTSGYSAEFGRLAGGVMSMVLKTGGNQFHGTVFHFVRNDRFDARNFFEAKAKLRRNQFGATLHGPVLIPKLYQGRDRTFFLFSWESYRQVLGVNRLGRVPEVEQRGGDFSQTLDASGQPAVLVDPLAAGTCVPGMTGGCFPGARIPTSRIHPLAARLTEFYPLPTRPRMANNFQTRANDADLWDSFLVKLDHRFSPADSLSFRYITRRNDLTVPFAGSDLGTFGNRDRSPQLLAGISYTRLFTPQFISEFRIGLIRSRQNLQNRQNDRNWVGELGIEGVSQHQEEWGFPRVTVRDLVALGSAANTPLRWVVNNIQVADTVTWVRHKHLIKFGVDILRTQFFQTSTSNNARGTLNFLGRWTNEPYGDFLLGFLNNSTRQLSRVPAYLFSTYWGAFVQDDWRVTQRMTFNLGLRYDLQMPLREKFGRLSNFIPEFNQIIVADDRALPGLFDLVEATGLRGKVALARDVGVPQTLVYPNYRNFAPRFGFAWRAPGRRTSVVRGAYGLFYGSSVTDPVRNDLTSVYPFTINQTFNRQTNNPEVVTLTTPFPESRTVLDGVTNASGFELRPSPQYLQSWNLTLERELGRGAALEIGYVGSKGTHLGRRYDINQPLRTPEARLPNLLFPRPISGLNTINFYQFGSNSIYHGGILTFRKQFRAGTFIRLNYIFSKSIDDASQISGNSKGGYPGAQDSRNLRLERARSDWDNGHGFTMNFVYQLPFRQRLLRGWQLAGTGRAYTGQPFTPRTSNVDLNQGDANRPDRIATGRLKQRSPERWFDLAAFPVVPRGSFRMGTSGRNVLDGPGFAGINSALSRQFRWREQGALQFRWEVFNVLNHTNFLLPEPFVNALNGATLTEASSARTMQFALKYLF